MLVKTSTQGKCFNATMKAAQRAWSWLQWSAEEHSVLWAKSISGRGRKLGWDRLSGPHFGVQACFSPDTARTALMQWYTNATKAQSISKSHHISEQTAQINTKQLLKIYPKPSPWFATFSFGQSISKYSPKNFETNHSLTWKEKACKNATGWISFPRLTLLGPRRGGGRSSRCK